MTVKDKANKPSGATRRGKGTADSSSASRCQTADGRAPAPSSSKKGRGDKPTKVHSLFWSRASVLDYQKCLDIIGVDYRINAYRGVQIKLPGEDWQDWQDNVDDHVYKLVQRDCEFYYFQNKHKFYRPIVISKVDRESAIKDLLHQNRYNPLQDWFNTIEESSEPIDLIGAVFKLDFADEITNDYTIEELVQYCIDFCCLIGKGVYLRTFKPGSSFPFFPVILGQQGCGKSMWCELLLPPEIAAFAFNRDLDMSDSNADRIAICQRAAVVECEEMVGHSRKDISDIKAFVSSPEATVRMPYARRPQLVKKHFVPINTTNDEQCLPIEPSGNRRWVMMPIARKDGWTKTDVEINLPLAIDKLRTKFWGYVKYLVNQKREKASYRHWSEKSREIRERLAGVATKRLFTIEHAIDGLLDIYDHRKDNYGQVLTGEERLEGIPFDVPGGVGDRSIMKLLPKEVTSGRYTMQAIIKVLRDVKGWTDAGRPRIGGKRCTKLKPPASATIRPSKKPSNEPSLDEQADQSLVSDSVNIPPKHTTGHDYPPLD